MNKKFAFSIISGLLLAAISMSVAAQQPDIMYFRAPDQRGLNTFEDPVENTVPYEGFRVRVGGNFTQQFQALSHENSANENLFQETDLNKLFPLGNGFNLATANLNLDVQINDGIRMTLEGYMSSRHHPEFWVKGGYIQVDKLPMFGNPQWFTDHFRVRIGHTMVNYGDQHFRRSDNGRTFYNPFVGNYIMDAFTTEIGGELYVFPKPNYFVMVGMTGGLISGNVTDAEKSPSILAKLGFDDQINDDLRLRLTGSVYHNSGTVRNTLYAGDRAGSRYYMAMEPEFFRNFRAGGVLTQSTEANRFTSGRFTPDFTYQITSFVINPFVKYKGLEFFGTYEVSSGTHNADVDDRSVTQVAGELIYRFLANEQLFVGARYNQVSGELPGANGDISIDRIQVALGWYTTKNLLLKLEYVTQNYNDFDPTDYRHGGKFSGFMIEAAVAF
ncbi:MAG: hypothetical protein RG741_09510 [Bacteroidales bacterium]|nr:hypothetical protein [Bacteroidales bacterium]